MDTLIETSNHLWRRWRVAEGLCSLAAVLLLFCTPGRTLDDTDAIPDALDRTYKEWMSKNDLTKGSLVAMKNGVVVKSFGYGDLQASQPAQIAHECPPGFAPAGSQLAHADAREAGVREAAAEGH